VGDGSVKYGRARLSGVAELKPKAPSIAAHSVRNLRPYALCGVIAPAFFALMVLIEQSVVPGYSWTSQTISDLGAYSLYGSYAIIQNVNFWAFGILVVTFTLGLRRTLLGSRTVTASLGLFGIAEVLGGVFPDQPFPLPGVGHDIAAVVAFLAIPICQLAAWAKLRHLGAGEESTWGRYRTYSLASGLLAFVLFSIDSFLPPFEPVGVTQRVFSLVPVSWLWIEVTALKLFRLSRAVPL
jgi:hypothetical membrane protein